MSDKESLQCNKCAWSKAISSSFTVSNGTRQGIILSPVLFNVYMDDLSLKSRSVQMGCYINGICFNHLFYADDTVLIAPSPTALQLLVDVCKVYINEKDLMLNWKKSRYMVFRTDLLDGLACPDVLIDNKSTDLVHDMKYICVNLCDNFTDDKSRALVAL